MVVVGINDMIKQHQHARSGATTTTEAWINSDYNTPLVLRHDSFGQVLTSHISWVMGVVDDTVKQSKEFWISRTTAILHEGRSVVGQPVSHQGRQMDV